LADLRVRMNYYGFPIQSNLFYIDFYNIDLIYSTRSQLVEAHKTNAEG
jgi:hypothetical protein